MVLEEGALGVAVVVAAGIDDVDKALNGRYTSLNSTLNIRHKHDNDTAITIAILYRSRAAAADVTGFHPFLHEY